MTIPANPIDEKATTEVKKPRLEQVATQTRWDYEETDVTAEDGMKIDYDKVYKLYLTCPQCQREWLLAAFRNTGGESIGNLRCPGCNAMSVREFLDE